MVFLRIILVFACISSTLALFFGPPAKECRSDRDCRGFRRTSCEGRGPNFLFIFPTCGRQRPYTLPGKCNRTPDTWCHIGNALGQRNRCNDGSRCAQCLGDQDCPTRESCRNYSCVRDSECSFDSDCFGTQECRFGECRF